LAVLISQHRADARVVHFGQHLGYDGCREYLESVRRSSASGNHLARAGWGGPPCRLRGRRCAGSCTRRVSYPSSQF
jgi:hypothetical protein